MKNTRTKSKKLTTIVNIVLDKSGSMEDCLEGTIEGFNSYIRKLRKEEGNVLVSLTLFDTEIEKRYTLIPVKEVQFLNHRNYDPDGATALWDAAVTSTEECYERTKDMIENKPTIISVIITDGFENSSKQHTRECMNDLVKELKAEGNWTFVYLGANQDSWGNASYVSMDRGNVANFESSNLGMSRAFEAVSLGTSTLMCNVAASGGGGGGTSSFFSDSKDGSDFIK